MWAVSCFLHPLHCIALGSGKVPFLTQWFYLALDVRVDSRSASAHFSLSLFFHVHITLNWFYPQAKFFFSQCFLIHIILPLFLCYLHCILIFLPYLASLFLYITVTNLMRFAVMLCAEYKSTEINELCFLPTFLLVSWQSDKCSVGLHRDHLSLGNAIHWR